MAMTARELVFFVRAENQASRVFTRVARDLRGLKAAQMEANAASRAASTKLGNLQNQARTVALQREQLTTGSKALNLQNRLNTARTTEVRNLEKYKSSLREVQAYQNRIADLNMKSALAQGRLAKMAPRSGGYAAVKEELASIDAELKTAVADGNRLAATADESRIAWAKASGAVNMLTAAEREAAQMASILLEREQAINAAIAEQSALIKRMDAEMARNASVNKINAITQAVGHLGSALRLAGAIGLVTFTVLAHHAAQFQSQTTLAATQARPNNAPVTTTLAITERLNKAILNQMQQFPASSHDMADSLYQIFSSTNATIPQAINLLKTFNMAAVAGGASLKSMTEAGITIRNNFPHEFANMTDAMQTFFAAVRYGRMNADQFANSLSYILPIAKSVRSNFKNVAQDMAFFTRQTGGRLTRQDAQGYARLIQLLGRTDVAAGLAAKGVDVFNKKTGAMRPLIKIMADINEKFAGQKPQQILNFFKDISAAGSGKSGTQGTIQAIRIFSQARENLKSYQDVVKSVSTDNTEFSKSYDAMIKSPGVRWAVLTNQLRAFATVLGEQALPALMQIGKPLFNVFQWFNHLSESTKGIIARMIVFGSAFALIGGQILMLGAGLARFVLTMRLLKLSALASEAGSVSTKMIAMRLGIVGILLVLSPLVAKLIGWKETLKLIAVALTALTFVSAIKGIAGVGVAATTATGEVSALRAALLSINGLVVTAAIVITYESFAHRKQIIAGINKALDKAGLPGIGGANLSAPKNERATNTAFIKQALAGVRSAGDFAAIQNLVKDGPAYEKKLVQDFLRSHPAFGSGGTVKPPMTPGYKAFLTATKASQSNAALAGDTANKVRGLTRPGRGFIPSGGDPGITDADVTAAAKKYAQLDQLANKTNSIKDIRAANNYINGIEKKFSKDQFAIFQQMYSNIESQDKSHTRKTVSEAKKRERARLAAQKKAMKEAQKDITDAAKTLQDTYQTFYQRNQQAFGGTFQGPYSQSARYQNMTQWGHKMTGKDMLRDIRSQVTHFKQWRRNIARLRRMGAPRALLDQLEQAGPESFDQVAALLTLNKADTRSYFAAFNQGQDLIQVATKQDMTLQLGQYRKYGRNIALQIIQGLRDERTPMIGYFENLVRDMFPGLAKAAKGAKGAGKTVTTTGAGKVDPSITYGADVKGSSLKPMVVRNTSSATVTHHSPTFVVQGAKNDADLKTQLRHAAFEHRNRYHL